MFQASGADTRRFDAVLSALGADAAAYFGDPTAILEPVEHMNRRFSSLLRVHVRTATGDSHAFVKIFKPNGSGPEDLAKARRLLENEYRTAVHLYTSCSRQPGVSAVRPVAVFPEQFAIVTTEVPGQTFDRVLRRAVWGLRPTAAIDVASRVGAWLRSFQELPPAGLVTAGREYLDVRLQAVVGTVLTAEEREHALRAYEALEHCAGPDATAYVAIHGDLCTANIIVQPTGEVTILDFSTAKTGTRYHDLAHLFLHIQFEASRMPLRRRFVTSVQRALVTGFDPAASPEDPLFKLMLLQHVTCHVAFLAERGRPTRPRVLWLRRRWQKYMPLWTPDASPHVLGSMAAS